MFEDIFSGVIWFYWLVLVVSVIILKNGSCQQFNIGVRISVLIISLLLLQRSSLPPCMI